LVPEKAVEKLKRKFKIPCFPGMDWETGKYFNCTTLSTEGKISRCPNYLINDGDGECRYLYQTSAIPQSISGKQWETEFHRGCLFAG